MAELNKLMLRTKILAIALTSIVGIVIFVFGNSTLLLGQRGPATSPSSAAKLSEQERRGEGLFLQRCSLCHLPRTLKFGSPPTVGPNLSGLFKEASSEQENVFRGFILKGSPNMPGFQYGLEPREVDDLIVFLKTL